jgi:hypothetical protein
VLSSHAGAGVGTLVTLLLLPVPSFAVLLFLRAGGEGVHSMSGGCVHTQCKKRHTSDERASTAFEQRV